MICKELLFEQMQGIDDAVLERSETAPAKGRSLWIYTLASAACFCLIAAAIVAAPHTTPLEPSPAVSDPPAQTTPAEQTPLPTPEPAPDWTIHYNLVEPDTAVDAARRYIPGYFTEQLTESDLNHLVAEQHSEWMDFSGTAGFDGKGNLLDVFLIAVSSSGMSTQITISCNASPLRCYLLPEDPIVSRCGDVEYKVYQCCRSEYILLEAEAQINGHGYQFSMNASEKNLSAAKEDFRAVLTCFAGSDPDLFSITADSIPEWFDQKLTLAQAQEDGTFGAYMLSSVPTGFTAESICRYKDQNSDYLSGLWCKGYDDLRWKVSYYSEADAAHLTSVADTQNYDLALYPIPRAESVPAELREIVDNPIFEAKELTLETVYARAYQLNDAGDSGGWRMDFTVKYGDILVEIHTQGISPEWVYEQLKKLPI